MMTKEFLIFADYSMIFVKDFSVEENFDDIDWSDEDLKSFFYPLEKGFVIGTVRNMNVPFILEVHESKPILETTEWDHIVECSIDLVSGILSISGTSDYIDDYRKVELTTGLYNALICYAGLGTISEDGLEGNDFYKLILWKSNVFLLKTVIKQWH
mgnify:CR=1 FL=1